eukprot:586070-Prorocentrum_minimum.AAC.2
MLFRGAVRLIRVSGHQMLPFQDDTKPISEDRKDGERTFVSRQNEVSTQSSRASDGERTSREKCSVQHCMGTACLPAPTAQTGTEYLAAWPRALGLLRPVCESPDCPRRTIV